MPVPAIAAENMAHSETRFKIEISRALTQYRLKKPRYLALSISLSRVISQIAKILYNPPDILGSAIEEVFLH